MSKNFLPLWCRTQKEKKSGGFFLQVSLTYIFCAFKKPSHILVTSESHKNGSCQILYQHGPDGCIEKLSIGFFVIMHIAHLITHLVKLSKIKGDKNFFEAKRGERYQIQTFDYNPPHFNGSIRGCPLTGLSLRPFLDVKIKGLSLRFFPFWN